MTGRSWSPRTADESLVFARILRAGSALSVVALALGFASYLSGLLAPWVPIADLPRYWGLAAGQYLEGARAPQGWGWLRLVAYGDFLNFVGIAMLASVTIVCYLAILPDYLRRGDRVYSLIVLLEIAILLLAASGWISIAR